MLAMLKKNVNKDLSWQENSSQYNFMLTHKIGSTYVDIDTNKKTYIDNKSSMLTYIDNIGTSTYAYGE